MHSWVVFKTMMRFKFRLTPSFIIDYFLIIKIRHVSLEASRVATWRGEYFDQTINYLPVLLVSDSMAHDFQRLGDHPKCVRIDFAHVF